MKKKKQVKYDEQKIHSLFLAGMDDKQIAEKLDRTAPNAWRSIQRIRLKNKWVRNSNPDDDKKQRGIVSASPSDLSAMDPDDKLEYLQDVFKNSRRFAYMFDTLETDEMEIFQEEYFKVLSDTVDDLSMTEEQSLFFAIYELVLSLRAQKNLKNETKDVNKSRSGEIDKDDPLFRTHVSERHEREYSSHMKQYQTLIDGLKLSRKQRLEKQIKGKKSFLDFSHEMATDDAQKSVAEKIRKINNLDNKELKRLIEEGYLKGHFEQTTD